MGSGSSKSKLINITSHTVLGFTLSSKINVTEKTTAQAGLTITNSHNVTVANATTNVNAQALSKQINQLNFTAKDMQGIADKLKENIKKDNSGNVISADVDNTVENIMNEVKLNVNIDMLKNVLRSNIASAIIRIDNSDNVNVKNFSSTANLSSMADQLTKMYQKTMSASTISSDHDTKEDVKTSGIGDNIQNMADNFLSAAKLFSPAAIAGIAIGGLLLIIIIIVIATTAGKEGVSRVSTLMEQSFSFQDVGV